MDLFLATCQGIGLALAAGSFSGASGRHGALGAVLILACAAGAAALFALSLAEEDHPAWPGAPAGALLALLAFGVVRGVVSGARSRTSGEDAPWTITLLVAIAALVLAGASLIVPPIGLFALGAIAWLGITRRRHAARKHEGLRILR